MPWVYQPAAVDESRTEFFNEIWGQHCLFCNCPLETVFDWRDNEPDDPSRREFVSRIVVARDVTRCIRACPACGWWIGRHDSDEHDDHLESWSSKYATWGTLQHLDQPNIGEALTEMRAYLLKKYSRRHSISPRLFEEIVGQVFRDLGYEIRVTSYSSDDGIDVVVLDGPDDALIGVQVKRFQGKIGASQIREFAGALLLGGFTEGVFVTTSDYTRGALDTAGRFENAGIPIRLWNSGKFFDRMQISQRKALSEAMAPHERWMNSTDLSEAWGRLKTKPRRWGVLW